VALARNHDSIGVAFTYTEPLMWYEYIMDVAPLLRDADLKVVLVSNGYINSEPLERLLPYVDAANIDLKGMRPQFYKRVCRGKLEPILDNLRRMAGSDIHLEITNLIIPQENDSEEELQDLIDFVCELGPSVPLHFSAYHPDYRMDRPATGADTLKRAFVMAREKLHHVFIGNLRIPGSSDSFCPNCGACLIERSGYRLEIRNLEAGKCTRCGAQTGIRQ
jgi:pyruvate formate lyase activating enzyme